jgi:5'-nucleotidase
MTARPSVLLTNDDGVDSPGLWALADALAPVADVTVVAPATDQSGVGRRKSHEAALDRREDAVALDGTPAACVQAGLDRFVQGADLVVAGCNPGPNVGEHVVGRSGTVGAAREAAFAGVPGLALSLYDPLQGVREFAREAFDPAGRVAASVATSGLDDGVFDAAPVLNVNVPAGPTERPTVRVTEPAEHRGVRTTLADGVVQFHDTFYDGIRPDDPAPMDHPVGSDIRALADGEVSVTPLSPGLAAPAGADPPVDALADRLAEDG